MKALVRHGGHRFRHHFLELWTSRGGGYYGFVGTLTFIYLETLALVGDVTGLPNVDISMGGIVGWFVQNIVTGVLNVVWASIWPLAWIQRFGVGLTSAGLLVGSYFVFHLLRPLVVRLLREPQEDL